MTYRSIRVGGCLQATIDVRADGATLLRATEPLADHPLRLTDRLEHWAKVAPTRTLVARRDPSVPGGGEWVTINYVQMVARARSIGQALSSRGLSCERPVVILSDNDLEHLSLALGAMWVGVPIVPVSPAYSLVAKDFAKLRHIVNTVTPGLVFASSAAYANAIHAVVDANVEVVLTDGHLASRPTTAFADLLNTPPGAEEARAHASVNADTIAKFLFTSGSTQNPKGVVNTQRMLCANQQMLAQSLAFLGDEPPVLVDWLPWNHTFGGNHNVGITLFHGGTLYIDEGKPTPAAFETTLRNLREVAPTVYFNVPRGFELLASAMTHDTALRERVFSRVKAFMYAGAGLSQPVWDDLGRLAEHTVGERIPIVTGLGMTETSPSSMFALRVESLRSGHIGLPCPGVEAKLVPESTQGPHNKVEVRFRGPHVMPGYWREPKLTAAAFDDEGFYCTGDAVRWVSEREPMRGLVFDGRLSEDFKLDSGTFVSVGPLRTRVVLEGAPCVQDVVVTGLNQPDMGLMIFPRLDACRDLAGLTASTSTSAVLHHPRVRAFFQTLLNALHAEGTGSATRPARAIVLDVPPSLDTGELTDKGSINQRAVLSQRAGLVSAMHEGRAEGLYRPTA